MQNNINKKSIVNFIHKILKTLYNLDEHSNKKLCIIDTFFNIERYFTQNYYDKFNAKC